MLYPSYLPHTVKHVILCSDTWSGQNRNQVVAALHHAVLTKDKIKITDKKFLQSGHSQMEFDAMHFTIERAKKTAKNVIPLSSRPLELQHHYVVVPLSHADSWNFKNVATSRFCNTRTDMKGDRVNWLTTK